MFQIFEGVFAGGIGKEYLSNTKRRNCGLDSEKVRSCLNDSCESNIFLFFLSRKFFEADY